MSSKETGKLLGLIPAAGKGTRIDPLPCSKELYPVGFKLSDQDGTQRPKAACEYLLEAMRLAGISKIFFILKEGKWDIPSYLKSGRVCHVDLAYLVVDDSEGVPFTLDYAFRFVENAIVAVGFPDLVFEAKNAFSHLLNRQRNGKADVVLGLFPTDQPQKVDMVDLDDNGRVRDIVIKPEATALRFTWGMAIWNHRFSEFLHNYLEGPKQQENLHRELFLGDVIQKAISAGIQVEGIAVSDSPFLDIGTPDDLTKAVRASFV